MTRASRRGITVVELVIAALISIAVAGALGAAALLSRRSEAVSDRDASLTALLLARESIERDLRRVLVAPGRPPVTVPGDGSTLSVWVLHEATASALHASPVAWHGATRHEYRKDGRASTRPGWPFVTGARFAVAETPAGTLVRVELTCGAEAHAFAVRVAVPSGLADPALAPTYDFRPLASFPDARP